MSVLGEVLGGAVPHEFIHNGKTFKVGVIDQRVKLGYEKKLFAKAKQAAIELKECMSRDEYKEHLDRLNEAYINGDYAFESKRGLAALNSVPGMLCLCSLLFNTDETELIKLLHQRKEEVSSLIALLIKESFPIEEADQTETHDPNASRPAFAS